MPSRKDVKNFGLGFGAAILVGSLWPAMREGLRPATKAMVRGVFLASERMKTMSAELQSEVEDLVAEVQFEKAQDHVAPTPTEEGTSAYETNHSH